MMKIPFRIRTVLVLLLALGIPGNGLAEEAFTALSIANMPEWITGIEQQYGTYEDADQAWHFGADLPVGEGQIIIALDRERIDKDLALSLVLAGVAGSDASIQLLDDKNRMIAVDLFHNVFTEEGLPVCDTFIVPVRKYPAATRIGIRRVEGPLTLHGLMLYPVVSEKDHDLLEDIETATLFSSPLSPDSDIWQAALALSANASNSVSGAEDAEALLTSHDAAAGRAFIGRLNPVINLDVLTALGRTGGVMPEGGIRGRFYVVAKGEFSMFLNDREIPLHSHKSEEIVVQAGDVLVLQIYSRFVYRAFRMAFLSADETMVLPFRREDFRVLDSNLTVSEIGADLILTLSDKPPHGRPDREHQEAWTRLELPAHESEWIWGQDKHTLYQYGAVIDYGMFQISIDLSDAQSAP